MILDISIINVYGIWGLLLNIIGAILLIFFTGPGPRFSKDGYQLAANLTIHYNSMTKEQQAKNIRGYKRHTFFYKFGIVLLVVGFFLQLVAACINVRSQKEIVAHVDTMFLLGLMGLAPTVFLVGITAWYAHSTRKMLGEMRAQVSVMQEQGATMQQQREAMQEQSALMVKSIQVSAYNALMIRHAALIQQPGPSLMSIDTGDVTDKLKKLIEEMEELEAKQRGKV